VLVELKLMEAPWAYSVMAAAALVDVYLLYVFFKRRRRGELPSDTTAHSLAPSRG
jgi:uncharacterized protein